MTIMGESINILRGFGGPALTGGVYKVTNPFVLYRNSGIIKLTNGFKIDFDRSNKKEIQRVVKFAVKHGVLLNSSGSSWNLYNTDEGRILETPQKLRFTLEGFDNCIFAETFLYDVHFVDFDLSDKIVVEAGGYVGDTALYYAYHGAKVYSMEPDAKSFEIAQRNISLNQDYAEKIKFFNIAMGTDGDIEFPVSNGGSGGSSIFRAAEKTRKVRSVSISTFLEENKISNPYLLHIDIKGNEYEAVRDESVAKFRRVRLEYSPYLRKDGQKFDDIVAILKQYGFKHIRVFKHNDLRYDLSGHGTIDAQK